MLQRTGAFKVRGAFNKMLALSKLERDRGVVAVSGGNHAQAVAYAARELSLRSLILMPEFTPAAKPARFTNSSAESDSQIASVEADSCKKGESTCSRGCNGEHESVPDVDCEKPHGRGRQLGQTQLSMQY
jgi:threonine dehydratase